MCFYKDKENFKKFKDSPPEFADVEVLEACLIHRLYPNPTFHVPIHHSKQQRAERNF